MKSASLLVILLLTPLFKIILVIIVSILLINTLSNSTYKYIQTILNNLYCVTKTAVTLSNSPSNFSSYNVSKSLSLGFIENFYFLRNYYILNDLIWQDGFLIDFVQKKIIDKWTRKFLIYSGYLFNERVLFDYAVRFFIDLVIWPGYSINIYEFNNVASTLLITIFLLIIVFLIISLLYFWILYF